MIKVGLSLLTVPPHVAGGAEIYTRTLLDGFAEHAATDVHATVLANDRLALEYRDRFAAPTTVIHVRGARIGDSRWSKYRSLAKAVAQPASLTKSFPPDLQVIHYPIPFPWPRTELPTVVTLHDVQHRDLPEFFNPGARLYRALAYDRGAEKADIVLTPTETSRERLLAHLDLDPDRVLTYRGAFDPVPFASPPHAIEDVCTRHGISQEFVLYPAHLWRHKNHLRLIDAWARISDAPMLVLTGGHQGRTEEIYDRATRRGIGHLVKYVGFLPESDLRSLVAGALLVVFPSLYEGFGTPPLEAMASGTPVAASDLPVLREVLDEAAAFFDPLDDRCIAEVVERVLSDEDLRSDLIARGRERSTAFPLEASVRTHVEAYARALAAASCTARA